MAQNPNGSWLAFRLKPVYKTVILFAFVLFSLVVYAIVRIDNLSRAVERVKSTADTTAYMRISREPVFHADFLTGSRPLLFPLLLKLLKQDERMVAWVQGIFSLLSWSTLALALAASLQTHLLKYVSVGLVLLCSLHQHIIGWDSVLLTESLSLSLMALFLAGWLWILNGWRWYKAVFLLVIALAWSVCRDTNAWVLLMLSMVFLILAIPGVIDRKYVLFSLTFGLMFFLSNATADLGGRWIYPFQNVLGKRLLPDSQAVAFLQDCGMPVSPALLQLSDEYADGQDRAFYNDPALESYRFWLYEDGKSCYTRWLLANPLRSFRQPLREFNTLVGIQNLPAFLFSRRFSPVLPARVEALLTLDQQSLLIFFLISLVALVALLRRFWLGNRVWVISILLTALIFPHYFIVWHGDVQGIERHVVSVGIQLYLAMWMFMLLVLDGLMLSLEHRLKLSNRTFTGNANL